METEKYISFNTLPVVCPDSLDFMLWMQFSYNEQSNPHSYHNTKLVLYVAQMHFQDSLQKRNIGMDDHEECTG